MTGRSKTKKPKTLGNEAGTQSERFIAKAREMGLDEQEETFDTALKKVARHKPQAEDHHEKANRK